MLAVQHHGNADQSTTSDGSSGSWADEVDELVASLHDQLGYLPYHATPERLYTPGDLYVDLGAVGFGGCVDQKIYRRARVAGGPTISPVESLAQRLHDHGITVALDEFRQGKTVVGVMGGHAMKRGSSGYRQVVSLGRSLTVAGFCVATGGGPGAMEAANLGAATSNLDPTDVDALVDRLAAAPGFNENVDAFIRTATDIWAELEHPVVSLSIPTWFYGHEPSNPFATHIAKYFSNSEREDGLLAIATGGIVFVQGGPGTLQEVFQDAAQNAYETFGTSSPMVFLEPPEGDEPFWLSSGVLTTLDRSFTSTNGGRRPGWELVRRVTTVPEAIDALGGGPV